MLHPAVLDTLLDGEMDVAAGRLGGRCRLSRHGHCVHAVTVGGGTIIRLDGASYDSEPFAVAVITAEHEMAPHAAWGPLSGGEHPLHHRPFACVRGTAEYHSHPSHLEDRWDLHRGRIQLVDLLSHLLTKVGA